ncbi:MAG: hypothetical protein M5U34_05930 [Chloroflexi bacterium]|nr:hypothetical protein [Chloroflexota bacterium]
MRPLPNQAPPLTDPTRPQRQDFASPSPQPAPPAAGADAEPISRRLDQDHAQAPRGGHD